MESYTKLVAYGQQAASKALWEDAAIRFEAAVQAAQTDRERSYALFGWAVSLLMGRKFKAPDVLREALKTDKLQDNERAYAHFLLGFYLAISARSHADHNWQPAARNLRIADGLFVRHVLDNIMHLATLLVWVTVMRYDGTSMDDQQKIRSRAERLARLTRKLHIWGDNPAVPPPVWPAVVSPLVWEILEKHAARLLRTA